MLFHQAFGLRIRKRGLLERRDVLQLAGRLPIGQVAGVLPQLAGHPTGQHHFHIGDILQGALLWVSGVCIFPHGQQFLRLEPAVVDLSAVLPQQFRQERRRREVLPALFQNRTQHRVLPPRSLFRAILHQLDHQWRLDIMQEFRPSCGFRKIRLVHGRK